MEFTDKRSAIVSKRCLKSKEYGFDLLDRNVVNTVLDIGANAGTFSLRARMALPTAKIIAYEPDKKARQCLKNNLKGLSVDIRNSAVGRDGEIFFRHFRQTVCSRSTFEKKGARCYKVPMISLPTLFEQHSIQPKRTMVKIDVEGSERLMMQDPASVELLQACHHVCLEFHYEHSDLGGFEMSDEQFRQWAWENFNETHWVAIFGQHRPHLAAIKKETDVSVDRKRRRRRRK